MEEAELTLFREAKQLLASSNGRQLTDHEWEVLGAAMIPINNPACRSLQDMTVVECLEELARTVEETQNDVAGRLLVARPAP